ncbi:MAG: adenosylcobinamide-GDP ribazoletransferase [Smithellaceae bacterium]
MIKQILAAVQFLTICPLPLSMKIDERDLGRSVPYFPVVGIIIGAAAASLDYGLGYILPLPVTSTLTVIFILAVSGALHMDGLADTADGFFSSRPRSQILEIMRDSRTGPMGVIAIVCVLILKVTLLTAVPPYWRWWVLLLTPLAGRCALLINMAVIPYARSEGGLGSIFYQNRFRLQLVWAFIVLIAIGSLVGGWAGSAVGLVSFVFSLVFAAYVKHKIGGSTGDTLGAACELNELVPALVCVVWASGGLTRI